MSPAEHRAWFDSLHARQNEVDYRIAQADSNIFDGDGNLKFDVGLIRVTAINHEMNSACVGADVFEQFRGKGYGKAVFAEACRVAESHLAPHPNLYLWVFMENVPAMTIYTKAGFIVDPDARVDTFLRDSGFVNYIRMVRPV